MADKPIDPQMNALMHRAFKREIGRIQVGVGTLADGQSEDPANPANPANPAKPANPAEPANPAGLVRRWEFFSGQLANHHEAEDKYIWPLVRERASQPDEMVIIDAMDAEHGTMQEILDAVDEQFAVIDQGGDVDLAELQTNLQDLSVVMAGHCDHEERDGMNLVVRYVRSNDLEEFHKFTRSAENSSLVFPWICDGAPEADQAAAWGMLPGFVRVVARPIMNRKYRAFKAGIN